MYLVFDTETTGLGQEADLLTAWFGVYDKNFAQLDYLDLYAKPDNGIYRVQAQGLEINQINLVEHDKIAIPYKQCKTLLYEFLKKNYVGEKLIPIGQNVLGDISTLCTTIISYGSWETFVSHRALDTMFISRFLQVNNKLTVETVSLQNLVEHFNINVVGQLHTAKCDALATLEVYKKLQQLI